MSAVSPLDRLAPQDFYHRLDRLRTDWHAPVSALTEPDSNVARYEDYRRQDALDIHERKLAAQLRNLRRLVEQLPHRYFARAIREYDELTRGRLVDGSDWLGAIARLRRLVSEWDRSRPPVIDCPECGVGVRGQTAMKLHRENVHGLVLDAEGTAR